MIRVDLDARRIHASVGALAAAQDDLPRPASPLGLAREALGVRIHDRWRRRREGADPAFRGEVSVRFERDVDGFAVQVVGRADGVTRAADGVQVEEVKSLALPGEAVALLGLRDLAVPVRQVRLYALALGAADPGSTVRASLHLVSVFDGGTRDFDVPFSPERVEAWLDRRLRRAIRDAEARVRRSRLRRRAAASIAFPFPTSRPGQDELAQGVAQALSEGRPALVEAPTGLGKTVAVLVPALRYALAQDARLFFLTAKGTQQHLAAKTFEAVRRASGRAASSLRAVTLRPKAETCPPKTLLCHPQRCSWLARFLEPSVRERALAPLRRRTGHVTPTAVQRAGRRSGICPHALSLVLAREADVLVADLNYVFDPSVRPTALLDESDGRGHVVIVDEAHNLFDRAREHGSASVASGPLEALADRAEAGQLPGFAAEAWLPGLGAPEPRADLTSDLAHLFREVAEAIDEEARDARDECPLAVEDTRPVWRRAERWEAWGDRAARLLLAYSELRLRQPEIRAQDDVADALRDLLRLGTLAREATDQTHAAWVGGPRAPSGVAAGWLCLDPAPRLRASYAAARGTVMLSATLAPLQAESRRLGLDALSPWLASLPSPFPAANRAVVIDPRLDLRARVRHLHVTAIARTIEEVVTLRPGRYAACFSSHAFLDRVREALGPGVGRVLAQRPRLAEAARRRLLDDFATGPPPALLLAVSGGVLTEGVDLPGEALVGVIVVGPALPSITFEGAALRHRLEAGGEDGFAATLLHPGMRRVVQAAGRVHRSPEDRGVIVLLGRRFAQPAYLACLPAWWGGSEREEIVPDDPVGRLRAFWTTEAERQRGVDARPSVASNRSRRRCRTESP